MVMKLDQQSDTSLGNILKGNLAWFWGLGSKFSPFLIYQSTTINEIPIMISWLFFTLLKVCTETIKNLKYHLLKIGRLQYIAILSKL